MSTLESRCLLLSLLLCGFVLMSGNKASGQEEIISDVNSRISTSPKPPTVPYRSQIPTSIEQADSSLTTATAALCESDELMCNNKRCIPKIFRCDSENDCGDNSDEQGCSTPTPCESDEDMCSNKRCIPKIFFCDGENDCGDDSDEQGCTAPPGSKCPARYFYCGNSSMSRGQCIKKSFRCDYEIDCTNGFDEQGCASPNITNTPANITTIMVGATYYCTCVAFGIPAPLLSWRLNGQRLPDTSRITVETSGGRSQLTVTNASKDDAGSYECQAMNSVGKVRTRPNCVLQVRAPGDACKPPVFNAIAMSERECHRCFCMGVSQDCYSASIYKERIKTMFTDHGETHGFNLIEASGAKIHRSLYRVDNRSQELVSGNMTGNVAYYWKLPHKYLGKKFVSYGGTLQYAIRYSTSPKSVGVRKLRRSLNSERTADATGFITLAHLLRTSRDVTLPAGEVQAEGGDRRSDEPTAIQPTTIIHFTTSQRTTTDPPTTSLPATSDQHTTTQPPTTDPPTTTQPTTTDPPTTSLPATSDQHTTTQPTTTDQHTTTQPATSDQYTTTQPTTTDPPTIIRPTTTDQHTTTQPTTTDPPTTSQLPATSDQHTTTQPTTTDPPTIIRPTTTDQHTTTQPSTTDPPTTSQRTTTDPPTTSLPATSDQHTTTQPTTTDPPTTTQPTTTDQHTTTQPTTTDTPTTSQHSTTDPPITTQPTTTDPPTTSQPTTTDPPTTTQPTTTDPPTTIQPTTTYPPTTSQSYTTDPPTTTQPTTTDPPTTSQPTTTDPPTTTQPTTTDPPTTSQPTTTDPPTTSQPSTTEPPTTTQPTTTDPPTTTKPTTTYPPTTTKPTTTDQHTTTQPTTTDPPTTSQRTITDPPTTSQSSTTDPPTTTQPTTTDPPTTSQPTTTDPPTTTQPTTTDPPTTSQPSTTDEHTTRLPTTTDQPISSEIPSTDQLTTSQPTTDPPTTSPPIITDQPITSERTTTDQSTTTQPTATDQSTTSQPTIYPPTTSPPIITDQHTTSQPNTDPPTTSQPTTTQPTATDQPSTSQPTATDKPTTSQPTTNQPSTAGQPSTSKRNTSQPTAIHPISSQPIITGQPLTGHPTTSQPTASESTINVRGTPTSKHETVTQTEATSLPVTSGQPTTTVTTSKKASTSRQSAATSQSSSSRTTFSATSQPTDSCIVGKHTYAVGDIFVTEDCSRRCLCDEGGRPACLDLCPPMNIHCNSDEENVEVSVRVKGTDCVCQEMTCSKKAATPTSTRPTLRPTTDNIDQSFGDVVLVGQGIILAYNHIIDPRPEQLTILKVPIVEDVWHTPDGRRASRADMMNVLSNVDSILIRAAHAGAVTFKTFSIKDVFLDVAVTENTGLGRAVHVEQCRCPPGYQGLSCESCSSGYTRDRTGNQFPVRCIDCQCHGHSNQCDPNNGTCFNCNHNTEGPFCDRCQSGFYGDARKGTPTDCPPCPCPLTRAPNRFSSTCYLDEDELPTCDACPKEYEGRNCERCSKNYTGNPLTPGETCELRGPDSCDVRGSYSDKPDKATRKCKCKAYVTGETCNECVTGFYGLGEEPYGGCLRCFCNAVTDKCASATLNRTQVAIRFVNNGSQDVIITNSNLSLSMDNLIYNPLTKDLVLRGFRSLAASERPLYWKLPRKFLGNKLTSYSGFLTFVMSYISNEAGRQFKSPTAIIKGNGILLKHVSRDRVTSGQLKRFSIRLSERHWRYFDNRGVSRDQLMVLLSSVDYLLIRAAYATNMVQTSLREVTMDIAVDRPTNQSRALSVEHCACRDAYMGLSCETCRVGHYRSVRGPWLGVCLPCACNGHSNDCDQQTSVCKSCKHNTHGDNCEKCMTGYYGDASVGTEDDCRPCACPMTSPPNRFSQTCFLAQDGRPTCDACRPGYTGRNCGSCIKPFVGDPSVVGDYCKVEKDCGCDPRGSVNNTCHPFTRLCYCKANVQGKRCNECKRSYFNLDSRYPDGCLPCFCFGVTSDCKCARNFRDKVTLSYRKVFDKPLSAIRLGDLSRATIVTTGILLVGVPPQLVYNRFDRLPRKTYYWYLPSQFTGEKISSYGGTLRYSVSHDMLLGGELTRETDVELKGRGLVLIHKTRFPPVGGLETSHHIKLVESSWTFPDGQEVSREDLMITLSAVESILIRATYSTMTYQASLNGAAMDVAVPTNTLQGQVYSVEQCACPASYSGTSCQDNGEYLPRPRLGKCSAVWIKTKICARGYTRVKPGPGFSRCTRCSCNYHSLECGAETGKCVNCDHSTNGDHCEICATGYYGDATKGTPVDCKPCSCPLTIASNQFSRTCRIDSDGHPTCTACKTGYTGRDCGRCVQGYTGNPRSPGGKCEKVPEELLPQATIWPMYRKDSEGADAVFYCLSNGKRPLTITWARVDDRPIPPRAQADNGAIRIPDVRKGDEGVYVCTVKNAYGQHTARARLSVLARPDEPITVSVSPKTLNIHARQTARFVCTATSVTHSTLKWTKGLSERLPAGASEKDGVLTIPWATRVHTGTYTCTGSNQYSYDQNSVQLRVAAIIKPQVSITPRFLTVDVGDTVEFRCSANGFPSPFLQWLGGPRGQLPKEAIISNGNSVLKILKARKEHEGEYFCTARNGGGIGTMRTMLYVRAAGSVPILIVRPKSLSVIEGDEAEFECKATGNPEPNIRWTRVEGDFPESSSIVNGVLRFNQAKTGDEGTYVCTAANRFGAVAESAVLNVEKDTSIPPSASVDPEEQTVNEGSVAVITCTTTGEPQPSQDWSRVGGVLASNHIIQGNQLSIENVTEKDEGMYVCIAQNKKGVKQATAFINVKRNVMPKIEIMPAAQQIVTGGDNVVFRCLVKAGVPPPAVTWTDREDRPINGSTVYVKDHNVLMFSPASTSNEGRYVCRATNVLGSVDAVAILSVQAEPRVVVTPSSPHLVPVGSQVMLLCSATGDPTPSVQWIAPSSAQSSLQPIEIKPGVLKLVIEYVTLGDQGKYRCMAGNVVGQVEASMELIVTPQVTKPPKVSALPVNITVIEGERAVFNCTSSGIPSPALVWERLGPGLPDTAMISDNGVFRIESASARDQGVYICTATNSEGSATTNVRLNVIVPPEVSLTPRQVSVNLGRPFRIFCASSPPLPLTWTKVNGSMVERALVEGGLLIVKAATVADTGKYRCQASNMAGSSDAFAIVTVFVAPELQVYPDNQVAPIGSNVTFTCNATGIPTPVITWSKENNQLPQKHVIQQGRLVIFDLVGIDQGRYTCTAANTAGFSRRDVTLTIEDLPSVTIIGGASVKTVPVGGNLTLECLGTGIPRPSIQWSRVEGSLATGIVIEEGVLFIRNARHSYGGAYRCIVTNHVGSVQSQIIIFVQAAPQVTITPKIIKIKAGEPVDFTCIASGSPAPEVKWRRLNGSLPANHSIQDGRLVIVNVSREDGGIYLCRATNIEGTAESFATIKIKGTIPRFEQSPISYMVFPTLTNEPLNFTIEIFFSPEIADGLILYNDQLENGMVGDFVSFGMSDGFAEFRFDLGSAGPAIIRSQQQLALYEWHTVILTREETEGTLKVIGQPMRKGVSKGKSTGLNLNQRLFLGGVANYTMIDSLAGFTSGFIGCVSYLAVNWIPIKLGEPLERVGLSDCEPCLTKPCKNGGSCKEFSGELGFVCHCKPGYKGRTCEGIGQRCHPGACNKGRCVNRGDSGFECLCPVGYIGERCEEGTKVETPMFDSSSFMSYPGIEGALLEIKLSIRFMAHDNNNMLLLYNGQRLYPTRGDFISLAIVDGKVEFRFDLGYGRAVIRSLKNITSGRWHTVVAERYRRDGSLILDSEPAEKSQAPCCSVGLNLALPLYVGGIDEFSTVDKEKLGVGRGFKGCISDVSIDDNTIDLVNSYVQMKGIKQCTECLMPCEILPCVNNGTCVPQGQTGYLCACASDYTGKNCEFPLVGPGKNRTCLNGGLPFPSSGRVCDCVIGYGGKRCESVVQLDDTMSFTGDGYVRYPSAVMKRTLGSIETMTVNIKTTARDGMILWQGQKLGASKGDYIGIGIRKGFLEFSYELGAGPAVLLSRRPVNDGQWHYVKVYRQSKTGALQVDKDLIVNGTSKEGARSLNRPGPIFIGGGEDIESLTYGRFSISYQGCVGGIYLQTRKLRLRQDAVQGYNVMPCDARSNTNQIT